MAPRHINSGSCPRCALIFDGFAGFHSGLRNWFVELQKKDPSAHISCAGRGKALQEEAFASGTSKAHYTQSAHNYNAAIDLFRLTGESLLSYDRAWFDAVVAGAVKRHNDDPNKTFSLLWYGTKGSPYFELPHIEVKDWKKLGLKLVEKA